jgi:hypothetical protein
MPGLLASTASVLHLAGPESVGKSVAANDYLSQHGVTQTQEVQPTAEAMTGVIRFAGVAPAAGLKGVLIRTDRSIEAERLGQLLRVLEEPPPWVVFLIVTSIELTPPVASRAERHQFGLLADAEVATVLELTGIEPRRAATLAPYGRGQVAPALALSQASGSRSAVVGVLRAIAAHDPDQAGRALREWDSDCQQLLTTWCTEAISGRWLMFGSGDVPGLSEPRKLARQLLVEISRLGTATPRLIAQVALESRTR